MGQFIQAFSSISLLNKVNLERRADKNVPSGKAWKLWKEMKDEYNPDDSIAEAELELALSKLKLTKRRTPGRSLKRLHPARLNLEFP